MASISAHGTEFVYNDKIEVDVTFNVGNCKLTEKDLQTLIDLRDICKENPTTTVDLRGHN